MTEAPLGGYRAETVLWLFGPDDAFEERPLEKPPSGQRPRPPDVIEWRGMECARYTFLSNISVWVYLPASLTPVGLQGWQTAGSTRRCRVCDVAWHGSTDCWSCGSSTINGNTRKEAAS